MACAVLEILLMVTGVVVIVVLLACAVIEIFRLANGTVVVEIVFVVV